MTALFDVEKFLADYSSGIAIENQHLIFDRLCKKVDVVKKVFCFYSTDVLSKRSDTEISKESYILLMDSLLLLTKEYFDLKYANSACKLNDLLLKKNIFDAQKHINIVAKLEKAIALSYEKGIRKVD